MKILVITQYFWPENFRINDLVAELENRGHVVTILTGVPNYPDGIVFPEFREAEDKFSTYNQCRVVRVPVITRGQDNSLRLILNFLSFAFMASTVGVYKLRADSFDVVFVYEPSPVTVGLPAVVIKRIKKVPVVFWVLDLWPETLEAVGFLKSKFLLGVVGKFVSYLYKHSDLILGQSKAFCSGIRRYCSGDKDVHYFPSWAEDMFLSEEHIVVDGIPEDSDAFKVVFAGNIGEAQDFSAILDAAELLKKSHKKIHFYILGSGRMFEWVKNEIGYRGLCDMFFLLGRHPLETMPSFYRRADVLLVSLKPSKVFSMTIPGKVQTYMMSGKPIIGMLDGEGARVIVEAQSGLTCRAGDGASLADNVIKLAALDGNELAMLGNNSREYAEREFNREKLITKLEEWFLSVSTN